MDRAGWQPGVIVGIDFGMTCTAIAYTMGPDWPEPKNIQTWPGKNPFEIHNKVDTAISYDINYPSRPTAWGFSCDQEDQRQEVQQYWKLNLDPQFLGNKDGPSHAEAVQWFCDYMCCIREHALAFLRERIVHFDRKNIQFVFSVPTTWKDPSMVRDVEQWIAAAGYGRRPNERAAITLTEAEAAAVYVLKQGMSPGETYVICDAGGGTTDLNILNVVSTGSGGVMDLKALTSAEGKAIGSTLIDHNAKLLVERRLKLIEEHLSGNLEYTVEKMMRDTFQSFKCSFGSEGFTLPKLTLPVPGLRPGFDEPAANVENSSVVILRSELQAIFDRQVDSMYELIDEQLRMVQDSHPSEIISHLVLSGGLGSSPYVRKKLKARYEMGMSSAPANAHDMKIYLAEQPQLAVVHGLVLSQIQTAKHGVDVYSEKCCAISLGVLCRLEYNEKHHQGEDITLDPLDKKRWAENQIQWVVKRGEPVSTSKPVLKAYRKKIDLGKENDPWRARIVMSTEPKSQLPNSIKKAKGSVREICEIETILHPDTMKRKKKHFWNWSQEYNLAEFQMQMLVGTGLRFEILGKSGKCSKDHEEIAVTWQPVSPISGRGEPAPTMYPYESPRLGRSP